MSIQKETPSRLQLVLVAVTAVLLIGTRQARAQVLKKPDSVRMDTTLGVPLKLMQVDIKGSRNTRLDSLFNRKDFAAVFKHKGPGFGSLFSQKVTYNNHYSPFQASTSSVIGINLLSLPGLFGKKSNPTNKLKRKLISEEEEDFVNRVFSKSMISSITGLQGDSVQLFQDRYRPTYTIAKQTTAYDMILYIKRSLKAFQKTDQ